MPLERLSGDKDQLLICAACHVLLAYINTGLTHLVRKFMYQKSKWLLYSESSGTVCAFTCIYWQYGGGNVNRVPLHFITTLSPSFYDRNIAENDVSRIYNVRAQAWTGSNEFLLILLLLPSRSVRQWYTFFEAFFVDKEIGCGQHIQLVEGSGFLRFAQETL